MKCLKTKESTGFVAIAMLMHWGIYNMDYEIEAMITKQEEKEQSDYETAIAEYLEWEETC